MGNLRVNFSQELFISAASKAQHSHLDRRVQEGPIRSSNPKSTSHTC